ncbi:MAG: EAL domain-containing protein [Actinobacteria bacterium]|nr:EAL domain-containing protein [Actinomycetota bacterium]
MEASEQTGGTERPDAARPSGWSPAAKVRAAITALYALGGLLLFVDRPLSAAAGAPERHIAWPLLALAFAVAEALVVHVDLGEDAHSFTLNELPMVVGLFLVHPPELILARVLGGAVVMGWANRRSMTKLAFNIGLFVTEVMFALLLFHGFQRISPVHGQVGGWGAAILAVLLSSLLTAGAVALVIAASGGRPDRPGVILAMAAGSTLATGSFGLLTVDTVVHNPAGLWIVAGVSALLFLVYRRYAALHRRYSSLQQLHEFTRVLAASPELSTTIRHTLEQARSVLKASRAELCLIDRDGVWADIRLSVGDGDELRTEHLPKLADHDLLVAHIVASQSSLLVPRGARADDLRRLLEARGARDLAACPLAAAGEVVGTIAVFDHLGDVSTFEPDDLQVFETLAHHVTVSLEKARLIDQLRVEAAEKEYQALHDALTGLGNRTLFEQAAVDALHEAKAAGTRVGVLVMDLNRFKDVNDTLGHTTGDLLLRQVADRLRAATPPGATPVRMGGDEFVFLLPGIQTSAEALALADVLVERLGAPFGIGGLEIGVGAAVGVAIGPDHGTDPGSLLQRADIAMYAAKDQGDGVAQLYSRGLAISGTRRLSLAGEIRAALEDGALDVHYQPIAELATGRIAGTEALLRWRHPTHGWVPPEDIVGLAEHLGLLRQVTLFVLDRATRQCRAWSDAGLDLRMSVNLAAQSLADRTLAADVASALSRAGLPAERLTLEITETQVIRDPDQTLDVLTRLHRTGITLAVDDFGTGFSSLSYLTRLPVDEVKIDKSFVHRMLSDETSAKVVRSIVDLGASLGRTVVAEGIEDLVTWDALAALGCDRGQGFHLSRPLGAERLTPWLLQRARRSLVHGDVAMRASGRGDSAAAAV